MTDTLIKNGTVVDGTGAKPYAADVRLSGGKITEIGQSLQAKGERVVDAAGCLVTPGFIDCHTHFDGAMWWMPSLDPLPGYGITTAIMGNCGFTAAPYDGSDEARQEIVNIFSFFEDISPVPLTNNLPWDWRSWPEYKKSVQEKAKTSVNVCGFIGHIPLRLFVMGKDAWERAATPQEIERMCTILDEAMKNGCMGLSSNFQDHDPNDRPVPTMKADDAELAALMDVLAKHHGAVFQCILDTFLRFTCVETVERLAVLAKPRNVRCHYIAAPILELQEPIRQPMMDIHERFKKEGIDFWPAFPNSSPTFTISFERTLIFAQTNDYVWDEVIKADTEEKKLAILKDPEWRARARHSWDHEIWDHAPMRNPDSLLLKNSENGVGPLNITLGDYARQLGVHASDAMAEWVINNTVKSTVHLAPFKVSEDYVVQLLRDPQTVAGVTDAGAHGQMFCGGGDSIYLLSHYARDVKSIEIEEVVHALTGKLSNHFGLNDRGVLKVGKRADICVLNLDEVERREEYKVYDVPQGDGSFTWRYTRDPAPVRLTLVNGVSTFEDGKFTGQLPGEFIGPVAA